ncbi:hypothetical protein CFIMG_005147RAa [Ceratocystis fimbriata CBS 114723]|uniref:Uncharacterized protein n=1 Tax=Ceratocystis fimbriata CBS 114723 TaxID=1035309 RepID=A0A2C5X3U7_9PEZI|nr:hypothetical protein CFIMG_005147RAa [Ceratocystis fimbriata CBS 114723]
MEERKESHYTALHYSNTAVASLAHYPPCKTRGIDFSGIRTAEAGFVALKVKWSRQRDFVANTSLLLSSYNLNTHCFRSITVIQTDDELSTGLA